MNKQKTHQGPVLIISMGVSGCGKSTLAKNLADELGFTFLEADDFHSEANRNHMASGKPLDDVMREPWIQSLCDHLTHCRATGESCVLAYSGLRRAHRQRFRELGYPTLYLHLTGPKELIRNRMAARAGHFIMDAGLLDSQYEALEAAVNEPDIVEINIGRSIADITQQAMRLAKQFSQTQTSVA